MILKMECKAKKVFMEMLLTMVKLLAVATVTQEKINKTKDMTEVQTGNSLSIEKII
jgi:hypothetical protein